MLTKKEFEDELKRYGLKPTERAECNTRLWEREDGALYSVQEFEQYPRYILEKFLEENGLYYLSEPYSQN